LLSGCSSSPVGVGCTPGQIRGAYDFSAVYLGSTIQNRVGASANLTLPAPDATGSLGGIKSMTINAWAADYRFVNRLYEDFLHRSAYTDSISVQWVDELESLEQQGDSPATARSVVASGIARSTEARNDVVNEMYHAFLKRSADPRGLSCWERLLASGATEEQIMANLLASGEFQSDTNNLQFVNQWYGSSHYAAGNWNWNYMIGLYEIVLKRAPSYQEAVSWYNALASLGYYQVAYDFVTSTEFRTDAVQSFYGTQAQAFQPFFPGLLDRSASPAEIVSSVNSGIDFLGMEIVIASSQEFYNDYPNV
jgi:hypothetical protein